MAEHNVSYQRPDYKNAMKKWAFMDDICAGSDAIKAKKETYLPKPNPNDTSPENTQRYEQYVIRAVFYGATGNTLRGLIGAVFRKWPVPNLPATLKYVERDVDGCGVSVFQQSQKVLSEVLKKARCALYVDYPKTEGQTSKKVLSEGMVRATISAIDANSVINWRTEQVGAVHKLALVVMSEKVNRVTSDGFGTETVEQLRELRLEEGRYKVRVWQNQSNNWVVTDEFTPTDGTGRPWSEIPFTFVGASNNDPDIDDIPLEDLAHINIAHYRNSADYEDSLFFCGQVQPWISGLDEGWRDWLQSQGIYCGSRAPMLLPENGAFGFAQAQPNTMVKEAMDAKESQMIALGARLVERGGAVKTATEAQHENESQHSVLSLAASNVSEAYTEALGWVAKFMNTSETVEYALNQDFVEHRLDAQMLTALIAAWQSGKYPESDLWTQLRKHGVIDPDKTDEAIKAELESSDAGLGIE
ncbi:DUF4055 domain-containing protein [Photobacterium sp. 1_MG-2023]|uniref:DUF4055 domain-containing protein n=1 Tax=Photobacterium sp. 1_MG-2023 TaxID=3062646 RepID=UPI0026E3DCED|nr:DUF4055 domain-containing protein [Photobacterium sp. 1_MG-2023]MDO6706781.1 DUF4055 domain-containing protein [Photobacterium sp. 1_MG-2023]